MRRLEFPGRRANPVRLRHRARTSGHAMAKHYRFAIRIAILRPWRRRGRSSSVLMPILDVPSWMRVDDRITA